MEEEVEIPKAVQPLLRAWVVDYDSMKDSYATYPYFGDILDSCQTMERDPSNTFHILDRFLFNGSHFCVCGGELRETLIWEFH